MIRSLIEVPAPQQLLLDIIDTIREPLLVLDPEFRVAQANRAFFRVFRVEAPDTIGEGLFSLGDGQWDIAPLRELLRDKLATEPRMDDFEVDDVFPGIGRKIMLLNARLVSGGRDAPRIILLAFEDITERRLTEWRLEAQRDELQRSNAALDEFASVASHDLQEPLRKILSFGDRLNGASTGLTGDGRLHLERMLDAAGRMRTLISDLLAYSQIATSAQPFVPTDLSEVARAVIVDLETAIAEDGVRIEVGALPTVQAIPLQMRQLLQNLLGNALKYRSKEHSPVIRVSAERAGNRHYAITVADNGIGFNNQYAEKIFKMFERLHGRTEYAGSGIGLAICRKIVERHGGTIAAAGTAGEGATFTITLPIAQTSPGSFS
jgi:two-component system CheB/CheR fusion protein